MNPSIRWRLTFWNTLTLAVVLTCFAVLVYVMLRRALLTQTDQLLLAGFGHLRGDSRIDTNTAERLDHWVEEFKDHLNLFCVIYRPAGSLLARTPGLADASVPPFPPGTVDPWIRDEQLPDIGRQRIRAERIRLGGQDLVVVLLAPLEAVDRELDQVRTILLTAGPIALLLSAGFGYWLARKALAPMDNLRRATDAITADHLEAWVARPELAKGVVGQPQEPRPSQAQGVPPSSGLEPRLPVHNPDDELGRLTRTINDMLARLARSFEEVRRFTADASHELRTPLTVLRTEVEVALGKQLSLADHQQLLGSILEELGRMSRLTDQLLTLSRRDAGVEHFTPGPVDLHALAADVVEAFRPLAETRGILLQLDAAGPIRVSGDEGRLRQVVINLLDNSLKNTLAGGRVTVQVGRNGATGFAVADTGIGIPPEHLPHVFDRFYRVDRARSRAEGGTGLGLSIAQSIVKAHGGTIEMTSTVGQGTICTVTLPAG